MHACILLVYADGVADRSGFGGWMDDLLNFQGVLVSRLGGYMLLLLVLIPRVGDIVPLLSAE